MRILTILEDKEKSTDQEAPLNSSLLQGDERLPEPSAHLTAEPLEVLVNEADLLQDVNVIAVEVPHPAQRLHSLLSLPLGEKPSRRLWDEEGADEKQAGRDELHGKRDDPLRVAGLHGAVDAVVDPETNQAADLPAEFVDADQPTANGGRRQLRDVYGRHVGAAANTKTCQNSASQDQAQATVSIGTKHDAGTDKEDKGEGDQRVATAKEMTRDVGSQTSEEGTCLVDRDDVLLQECKAIWRVIFELELLGEGREG